MVLQKIKVLNCSNSHNPCLWYSDRKKYKYWQIV